MYITHKADQWGEIMAGAALAAAGPGLRGWTDGPARGRCRVPVAWQQNRRIFCPPLPGHCQTG